MSRRLVDEDDLSDQRLYTDEEIHVFYGQLVERLKAEGVYREDEDESKEKNTIYYRYQSGLWKNQTDYAEDGKKAEGI